MLNKMWWGGFAVEDLLVPAEKWGVVGWVSKSSGGGGGDSPPQYMVRQGKEMTLIIQILMIEQKH